MIEKVGEVYAIPPVYIIINKCDLLEEEDDEEVMFTNKRNMFPFHTYRIRQVFLVKTFLCKKISLYFSCLSQTIINGWLLL